MAVAPDPRNAAEMVKRMLHPWHQALADPVAAQETVLHQLLVGYARTGDGNAHGAGQVRTLTDYRRAFPVRNYEDYKPLIRRVMAGEESLLLVEAAIGWAITRGTTAGEQKFIPMTPTDLQMRVQAGRAMLEYASSSQRFDLFTGVNLNLNFPSVVGHVKAGDRDLTYGYSSGIYVKHVSAQTPIRSSPTQDEIDSLGGGNTIKDWEARFELAFQRCREENVTLVGGVAPTAILFGRYLKRKHGVYPKDLWRTQIMTLGSIPAINTRFAPQCTDRWPSGRSTGLRKECSASRKMNEGLGCRITICSYSKS
jgi:hypothetical protein